MLGIIVSNDSNVVEFQARLAARCNFPRFTEPMSATATRLSSRPIRRRYSGSSIQGRSNRDTRRCGADLRPRISKQPLANRCVRSVEVVVDEKYRGEDFAPRRKSWHVTGVRTEATAGKYREVIKNRVTSVKDL